MLICVRNYSTTHCCSLNLHNDNAFDINSIWHFQGGLFGISTSLSLLLWIGLGTSITGTSVVTKPPVTTEGCNWNISGLATPMTAHNLSATTTAIPLSTTSIYDKYSWVNLKISLKSCRALLYRNMKMPLWPFTQLFRRWISVEAIQPNCFWMVHTNMYNGAFCLVSIRSSR